MRATVKIELERRNFMRDNPELYAYIKAHVESRAFKTAGDYAGGVGGDGGHGAANRCYALAGRAQEQVDKMRDSA